LEQEVTMPRQSAADRATIRVDGKVSRLKPPSSLSAAECEIFTTIVGTCTPEHFRESDLPLLLRFVESTVLAETAAAHLRRDGAVVGKRLNPWLHAQEKAIRSLVALSMRLRISPQSRCATAIRRDTPRSTRASVYDLLEALNGGGDGAGAGTGTGAA
jgi:phage terminase small subunit